MEVQRFWVAFLCHETWCLAWSSWDTKDDLKNNLPPPPNITVLGFLSSSLVGTVTLRSVDNSCESSCGVVRALNCFITVSECGSNGVIPYPWFLACFPLASALYRRIPHFCSILYIVTLIKCRSELCLKGKVSSWVSLTLASRSTCWDSLASPCLWNLTGFSFSPFLYPWDIYLDLYELECNRTFCSHLESHWLAATCGL